MHIYLRIEGEIMNQKPTVKEIQEEILILLSELDRVCRKNNIKYSLHGGTLQLEKTDLFRGMMMLILL